MVSLEGLTKVVDPSQLTADFDGSLDYNHEEWIEVRQHSDAQTVSIGDIKLYLGPLTTPLPSSPINYGACAH